MLPPAHILQKPLKVLPLNECLAKTVELENGLKVQGVTVATHCEIVGTIAQELLHRQPVWLKDALFPSGSELIAAAHDLGKVSPHFQEKIYVAINEKNMGIGKADLDKTLGGHATISQACIADKPLKLIPKILGRHHGSSPSNPGCPNDEIYGGKEWQELRMQLLDILKKEFKCDWPMVTDEEQANALSGLVCVADWIGSGSLFNGVFPNGTTDPVHWKDHILPAVDSAGFVNYSIRSNLTFEDIFSFTPRDAQVKLISAADRPGVYVLEAPMGMGKTEAALYAAYQVLAKGTATGIYFALPTQLTSNKIYDRMNVFLEKILTEDCKFRSLLLHSSAWLRDTELGEEGMPGESWFNSSKRGLLAPFAVGTIDQALMGVLNVKHGFVRTFGLAGKVVVLDEVHSYDSYTGTILNSLVSTLQKLHCTVIILSATLTAARRSELLGAENLDSSYPLVSASPKTETPYTLPVTQSETSMVALCVKNNTEEALNEALLRAERGEQVLWIENIVSESQDQFETIAARAQACNVTIEVGLVHSRFLRKDRKTNEEHWVKVLGKEGHATRNECGRILVGTQVLEQSLDIDADFLITRICPTDMLLQRIGRLWRHRETDKLRPPSARCEAWILAPRLTDCKDNPSLWGKSGKVYMPYVLYRSLEIWDSLKMVTLPQDIRPLLEGTYSDHTEIGVLNEWKNKVNENRKILQRFARIGLATIGKPLSDNQVQTRYCETESNEVLLIRIKELCEEYTTLTFLDGTILKIPMNIRTQNPKKWRSIAAELQQNVVMVPNYAAPITSINQIPWLKDFVYLGHGDESPFRVALMQEDGVLAGIDHGKPLSKYQLAYSCKMGYKVTKINETDSPEDLW